MLLASYTFIFETKKVRTTYNTVLAKPLFRIYKVITNFCNISVRVALQYKAITSIYE